MKQHITVEQLNELSVAAKSNLREWSKDKGYIPLPSIGQMIEFLGEHQMVSINQYQDGWEVYKKENKDPYHEELCDSLWEAVKQVLEKE